MTCFCIKGGEGFSGFENFPFKEQEISQALVDRSNAAVQSSLNRVKSLVNSARDVRPEQLQDIGALAMDDPLVKLVARYNPRLRTLKVDPLHPVNMVLADALLENAEKAYKSGAKPDAVALIAPNGRVLLIAAGKENESPIRTALMELIRGYTTIRNQAGQTGGQYLPHPKHCKIVLLFGPGQTAADYMELGAVGSMIEGQIPETNERWMQYIVPSQQSDDLSVMVNALPPLYRQIVRIQPIQCDDSEVHDYCARKLARIAPDKARATRPLDKPQAG